MSAGERRGGAAGFAFCSVSFSLLFSKQEDSDRRLLTQQLWCSDLLYAHERVFNFTAMFGVKPEDVVAESSPFFNPPFPPKFLMINAPVQELNHRTLKSNTAKWG